MSVREGIKCEQLSHKADEAGADVTRWVTYDDDEVDGSVKHGYMTKTGDVHSRRHQCTVQEKEKREESQARWEKQKGRSGPVTACCALIGLTRRLEAPMVGFPSCNNTLASISYFQSCCCYRRMIILYRSRAPLYARPHMPRNESTSGPLVPLEIFPEGIEGPRLESGERASKNIGRRDITTGKTSQVNWSAKNKILVCDSESLD